MNPHLQGRLETQGRTDVAAWVWRQFGDKIPSYLGNLYFFFSLGLQLIWWGPPTSRTNTQKRCPSHYMGLECRSRKSRDTWSNRQIWPCSTEWGMAKANRVLPREHTGHSKHLLPTTQEKTTHGHHQMVNTEIRLIIFFAAKVGEALYSQQKQDQELAVAQIINSLLPNSDLNWRK